MRLISWNVNGLRACVGKGFLDFFHEIRADAVCLQETKMQPDQLTLELEGYSQYWNSAVKKGYSGTAIFTKLRPISVKNGMAIPEHDNEGRVITCEYETFYLVTVYTPNAQSELARLDYRMTWDDAFREYLLELDAKKPVIVCGDMNVAHKEIDLKNPGPNRGSAGFTDEEREKFTRLLESASPIVSAICIPISSVPTAGGATASKPVRTTQGGVLTTFWYPTASRIRL